MLVNSFILPVYDIDTGIFGELKMYAILCITGYMEAVMNKKKIFKEVPNFQFNV